MLQQTCNVVCLLMQSFRTGNAIREGVGVAIVGAPNVGKSTLLNRLIGDDRAMVSDIAGTTRDTIEESIIIDDIRFRFIDTAGIRKTDDLLEQMGIDRTLKAIERADIIINMAEPNGAFEAISLKENQSEIRLINKADTITLRDDAEAIYISARDGVGIENLRTALRNTVDTEALYRGDAVVSNVRHFEALSAANNALSAAMTALSAGISSELLAEDIRSAISHLGEITGEITSDTILQSIFSSFCIGK